MELNEELGSKIQELQLIERNLQNFSIEKQNLQVELNQINNALEEIKKAKGDVFKILKGVMIKAESGALITELEERKKIIDLRITSVERQENSVTDKAGKLRDEINKSFEKKK